MTDYMDMSIPFLDFTPPNPDDGDMVSLYLKRYLHGYGA